MAIGALLVLLAGFSLAMVPVVFWPIGKRYNETLALGYVVFRGAIETVLYIVGALAWLLLIPLSTQPDTAPARRLRAHGGGRDLGPAARHPVRSRRPMFYILLYQSRLVPRWLSVWALVGAALYIGAPLGSMFGLSLGILMGPLAVQEMVMAVWLIAKGFNTRRSGVSWRHRHPAARCPRLPQEGDDESRSSATP